MKEIIILLSIIILFGCTQQNQLIETNSNIGIKEVVEVENKKVLLQQTITGNSMSPMMKSGDEVMLDVGFYDGRKNPVELGDIVSYDFKGDKNNVIKVVVARDSDSVEIKNNTLFVNGKEVKNSIGNSYNFSQSEQNMMKLYINEEGKIPENSVFILGDNVGNSTDSRRFGAISLGDISGKYIFNE